MAEAGGNLVLYVRDGCHLCDQFLLELERDLGAAVGRLRVLDVEGDAGLAARYGLRVPVLALDGEVVCEGIYDRPRVRHALRV